MDEPAAVEAVDLNPHHIYLTRLKIAALALSAGPRILLPVFRLRGLSGQPGQLPGVYPPPSGRSHAGLLGGAERGCGALCAGRASSISKRTSTTTLGWGYFMRFLHNLARLVRKDPTALLRARNQQEQEEVFEQLIGPFFDNAAVRFLGNMPFILFGLGIPPHQYNKIREETGSNILAMYRERAKRLACGFPLEDNYFTWMAFGRGYDTVCRQAVPGLSEREPLRNSETQRGPCANGGSPA